MELGLINKLKIERRSDYGLYLTNEDGDEVLLPNKYCPEDYDLEQIIEVFLFKDHKNRLTATTAKPLIYRDQIATLKINSVTKQGAFAYIGLEKDLFIPYKEQHLFLEEEQEVLVYMYYDRKSDRLAGSTRLNRFFPSVSDEFENDQEVQIAIWEETDLGYKVIIDQKIIGLIYENEIFKKVNEGDQMKAFIKTIREDQKIDVRLQRSGYENMDDYVKLLFIAIENNDGFLPIHDKSPPELIKEKLNMSKKNFKKAVGALYKSGRIKLLPNGLKKVR